MPTKRVQQRSLFEQPVPDELEQASFADQAIDAPRPHEYLVPKGGALVHCRSCDAEVVWTTTPAGAAVPLSIATVQKRHGELYALSHFTDCPQASAWGKGKKRV